MKKALFIIAAALVVSANLDASASSRTLKSFGIKTHAEQRDSNKRSDAAKAIHKAASAQTWKVGTERVYHWDSSAWALSGEYTYTYDDEGRLQTSATGILKDTYSYNADGELASILHQSLQNNEWVNEYRYDYGYDAVVKSFTTSEIEYVWVDNDWRIIDEEKKVVTRNEAGNITKIEELRRDGMSEPDYVAHGERLTITYGESGQAATILLEDDAEEDDVFQPLIKLEDIEWYNTDGQITNVSISYNDEENLLRLPNRIKSCTLTGYDTDEGFPITGKVSFVYTDGNGSYTAKATQGSTVIAYESYSVQDENGSFIFTTEYPQDNEKYVESCYYDSYGLETTYAVYEYEDDELLYNDLVIGHVTYDATEGYPLEIITEQKDYDTNNAQFLFKREFSDYVKITSGIEDVAVDGNDAPVEYFNLQGIRVSGSNLAPGIYIRRQGSNVSKIAVQ